MNAEVLAHVGLLGVLEQRAEAARHIARALGVDDLLILLRDRELDILVPAPGFRQSFPDGKTWRAFLDQALRSGEHRGRLPVSADVVVEAQAFACNRDTVLLLLGGTVAVERIQGLLALMPLITAALGAEQVAALAAAEARMARDTAARAALLAQTVDRARLQLEQALREAGETSKALEEANARLQEQAVEQEFMNEQLRDQTDAQGKLTEELATQAAHLRETIAELETARTSSESANKAKTEFLATMSHELRTPLNAIGGHVALLAMGLHGVVTPEQQNALTRIDRNQRHLLGLINDILNLSRIEAGKVEYRLTDVSLEEVVNDLAPMIMPQLAEKSLAYRVSLTPPLPLVRADREKFEQIMLNLLSNAVKFTPAGGKVWVDAKVSEREPGKVYVRVSDTGVGIPRDKLETIFEPFTQVDGSHSRLGQGPGLGLAISRDLARGMGGDLRARSILAEGSSFTVTLDAAVASESTILGEEPRASQRVERESASA